MDDRHLCAVDALSYNIQFTYESDDGLARSWPDHVLTLSHCINAITDVRCIHSTNNFSDHIPLCFCLNLDAQVKYTAEPVDSMNSKDTNVIDWNKVEAIHIDAYQNLVKSSLPHMSSDLLSCSSPGCQHHQLMIDTACEKLFSCLHSAAQDGLPKRSKRYKVIPGWNDSVRILRSKAIFWNRMWTECGCPSNGVLSQIRKRTKTRYKYAVRSAKRRKDHTVSRKISSALSNRNNRLFWKEIKRIKLASSGKQAPSPIIDGLIKVADITNNFSSKLGSILNSIDDNNKFSIFT